MHELLEHMERIPLLYHEVLEITTDTAKEYFNKLKKAGKLERVGGRKRGTWQVLGARQKKK